MAARPDRGREEQAERYRNSERYTTPDGEMDVEGTTPMLGWVVAGLESGDRAREGEVEHMESVQEQCAAAGVPYFGKQLGSRPRYKGQPLKLKHPHGSKMSEWPEHLRVQQWPRVSEQRQAVAA